MSEVKLPIGWKMESFTSVFDISGGTQPPKSNFIYEPKQGYIRLLQIRDFGEKPVPTFIPQKKTLKTCKEEDVLIARYGASIGRILTGMDGAYNVAIAKVIIPENINNKYVFWLLNSSLFQSKITSFQRTAQNGFNKNDLEEIHLPIAPPAEQQRIVARLDAVFGHLDVLQEKLDRIPVLLKNFRQQVLTQAVTGNLTKEWREKIAIEEDGRKLLDRILSERKDSYEQKTKEAIGSGKRKPKMERGLEDDYNVDLTIDLPSSWAKTVVDKIGLVQLGATPPRGNKSYWNGQIPWVSSGEVANNKITNTAERISELGFKKASVKLNPPATVLIAMIGEGKTRGQSAILAIEACTNQNIAAIVSRSNHINPVYLWYHLLANYEKNRNSGRGGNQPALNGVKVGEIFVNLPSLMEQKEIVKRVDELFAIADKIESQYQTLKAKFGQLPQAILAKAFRGELVGQEVKEYVGEAGEVGMVAEAHFDNKEN